MAIRYRFLERAVALYIKSQAESGDPIRTKIALQQLCKLYRDGYRLLPDQAVAFEQSIVGLLYTQRDDEKVRRWALNTLARLGKEATCMEAIGSVLRAFASEPQTLAAAIAAIYRISRNAEAILKREDFDQQLVTLAALQHVDTRTLDLCALPLNVDGASSDHLQLALVVVGLNRAPANLLNPRHSNAEMVRALGKHHDKIVAQYSVWAITENPNLNILDLGVDIRDIERYPPNVRSWIFRLLAMDTESAQSHMEYLSLGITDPSAEARGGLALGLRNTFFDGLDELTLDWFMAERDTGVRHGILDHLVAQAHLCASYEPIVVEIYEKEPPGSDARQRMEASAAGKPLFGRFREIDLDGSRDLFGGGGRGLSQTINISGPINAGAVSVGGNAENSGSASIHYNPQTVEAILSHLAKAERELHALPGIEPELKKEALEQVQAAKSDPKPDQVSKAVKSLEKVEAVASKAVGAATALAPIGTALLGLIT